MEMDEERMTLPQLSSAPDWLLLFRLVAFLAAGGLAGALYFYMVWRNARSLRQGGRLSVLLALMMLRFTLLASLLAFAAWQGAGPLLGTALGVFTARAIVMRKMQGAA